MSQSPTDAHLKRLKSSIGSPLPFCSGIIPVKADDLAIFYRKDETPHWLGLHRSSTDSLEHLANTCEPAKFGRNNENIYDESYRKAGRLGSDSFRPMLDVKAIGLIDLIRERLLGGSENEKAIRAELYNLNVYGEGSFFKAHVDTPRSEVMFGSLVVFFPTAHEGGSLLMRKNGVEWSFDSAKVLVDNDGPCLGYVALYSDVEHEVAMVTSGYRVTITYNLYFDRSAHALPAPLSSVSAIGNFKDELSALLANPEFLPNGGYLGFGLEYAYALSSCWSGLSDLKSRLKGIDADLMQEFRGLSLVTSFWSIINSRGDLFACEDRIPDCSIGTEQYFGHAIDFPQWMVCKQGALVLKCDSWGLKVNLDVHWVKDMVTAHRGEQKFVNYGNESFSDSAYHNVCLIVKIGKPGSRGDPESLPEPTFGDSDEYHSEDEWDMDTEGEEV